MRSFTRALLWLAISAAALLAGLADVDLRLIAAATCGLAVLTGSGLLDNLGRRPEPPPQASGSGETGAGPENGRNA